MIKSISSILFSTRTMGMLLLLFALAMAVGTFVENDYGTPVAKALIYNCWWFELVMLLLVLNFIGNIFRYRLLQLKKLPLLVFHLAFIIIFIGGFCSRYIGYEGIMHIREKELSNEIVSDATFFKVQIGKGDEAFAYDDVRATLLSDRIPFYLKPFKRSFVSTYAYKGEHVSFKLLDYYNRAQDSLLEELQGSKVLHLVVLQGGRVNKYIPSGEVQLIGNVLVSYNKNTLGAVNINDAKGLLTISAPFEGNYMIMSTQQRIQLPANKPEQPLQLRTLYSFGSLVFVAPDLPKSGHIIHTEGDKKLHANDPDLIEMEVSTPKKIDTISFYGGKGMSNFQYQGEIGGYRVSLAYGSQVIKTPFSLKLEDFKMEKYPGSNSPSSYSSEVMIEEGEMQTPYIISMNHVLDHGGYRFFQASFDQDELGSVLSVNHDRLGTTITYIGYTLLFIGMFFTLFWKDTRFHKLREQLKTLSRGKAALLFFLVLPISAFSQQIDMHGKDNHENEHVHNHQGDDDTHLENNSTHQVDLLRKMLQLKTADGPSFAKTVKINPEHAELFGSLLVQNIDGRIEPINTLALEVVRKLMGSDHFYNLNANQFFLSISVSPFDWVNVPLIKVSAKGGQQLLSKVKADQSEHTSMMNLISISPEGNPEFILAQDYQRAFAKKPAEQDVYDKEVIQLNDKLYAMQQILDGEYLKVIPIAGDSNNTWSSVSFSPGAALTNSTVPLIAYIRSVVEAQKSSNWSRADAALGVIKKLQTENGGSVIPSKNKIQWEVYYNSWNLFLKLMITYAMLGVAVLSFAFLRLFKDNKALQRVTSGFIILICLAAALHAVGLGVRWYISGHEPWSNGYEAVLFISWIGVLSGLLLYKNSNAFIPAAGCLIAVILIGFAHGGSQMNPQITPLVPVLKSYWLMIHVAIITSSYGFFGLSALLGTVVLILYIINSKNISSKVDASIHELTLVNEVSITVGLFLLTIGTFIGGIWANESWGRYWSWDPKETWAFISVIVYAFVLHIRLIPGLQGKYLFNLLSLICFSTIIMTYFGVNYYLSGLHSYAQGDPVPVPLWVYTTIVMVALLAIISYSRYKRSTNKNIIRSSASKNEKFTIK